MKNINKFLVLIIGLSALTSKAQNADSVIVIYDNQKTVIPLPALGSQTSVSYADSTRVVEIGVWVRKPDEISIFPQHPSNNLTTEKPKIISKWLSQIDAGYVSGIMPKDPYPFYIDNQYSQFHFITEPLSGYNIGLSVYERDQIINDKYSFVTGFKFGFGQNFRKETPKPGNLSDTIHHFFIDYDPYSITRFRFLIPIGLRYHFKSQISDARINLGTNIGSSFDYMRFTQDGNKVKYFMMSPLILQPYLGFEYKKIGFLFTSEFSPVSSETSDYYIKYSLMFSLSYRIF